MDRREAATLIETLERDAARIARVFGLRYRSIAPERPQVKRRLGVCYRDGSIRIRLSHATTGRALKYSSLVDTLCHELAHLRHFNHGRRFQALYRQILDHARREGIYRPGADESLHAPKRPRWTPPEPPHQTPRPPVVGTPRPGGAAIASPPAPAGQAPQQLALF
jgi:hypothetical protein